MSARQVASILGVNFATVTRWVKSGHANAEKVGGVYIFSAEEVERLAKADRPRIGRPRKVAA